MAQLQQERHSEFVSGTEEQFVITNFMLSATIPAQLPHLSVFVLVINDRLDAKKDTLARVARISDLSALPIERDAGLASKTGTGIEYLSRSCRVAYPTLDEAEAGKQAFIDRVNALINDWISFETSFNAPDPSPAVITLPTSDPSQLQALINAYKAAKQARYTAQQTKASTAAAVTAAQTALTDAQSAVNTVSGFTTTASILSSEFSDTHSALLTLRQAGTVFLPLAACAAAPDKTTFQAALDAAQVQINQDGTYLTDFANFLSALNAYLTTLNGNLSTAQINLSNAQSNDITAGVTLTQAQAAETATLNAVLAICPDFQASSVCQVPG